MTMSAAGLPPPLKQTSSASAPAQQVSNQFGDQQPSPQKGFGGSSSSFSSQRQQQGNPRGGQNQRSKHKNHKRPNIPRDDFIAEAAAMASTNSRKGQTSITHLINWSLPPRPQQQRHYGRHQGHGQNPRTTNRTWGHGSGYHAVDKARYVNANYRFIVNPNGDYRAQQLDPDSHIPWNSVLQILASSITQTASCPICLSEPTAPRMAKCGHIFCLPCLIRYMDTSTDDKPPPAHVPADKRKKWKKCPICYDSVYMAETRPVKFYTGQEVEPPREGSDIMLRLMMRKPGTTLALPRDVAVKNTDDDSGDEDIPWYYAAEVTDYARVMKGTEDYMTDEYRREVNELEEMERFDELMYGEEGNWTRQAVRKINAAMEEIKGMGRGKAKPPENSPLIGRELLEAELLKEAAKRAEANGEKRRTVEWKAGEEEVPEMYMISTVAKSGLSTPVQDGTGAATPEKEQQKELKPDQVVIAGKGEPPQQYLQVPAKTKPPAADKPRAPSKAAADIRDATTPYYFYQALPHSYLHALDIRILKSAFGSFSAFPSTVLPRLENFSTRHMVDDDLRKRAKYMSHLPYGCEVAILECDWTDIVPEEILDKFKPDLEKRRKRKKEKEAREERDRIRAEREEEGKGFAAARLRKRYPNEDAMPEGFRENVLRDEEFVSLAPAGNNSAATPDDDGAGGLDDGGNLLGNQGQGRIGFDSLPQSSPPSASRTVWGTPIVGVSNRDGSEGAVPEAPTTQGTGGWLEDWETDLLLQQELQSRSANTAGSGAGRGGGGGGAAGGGGGGKGKKKFKKVTLLTNQGNRRA